MDASDVVVVDSSQCKNTTYYILETMGAWRYRMICCAWVLLFILGTTLISRSVEMQFSCQPFCSMEEFLTCNMLHSSNTSDQAWLHNASSCFDPLSSTWLSTYTYGGLSFAGNRFRRFVLRFSSVDYDLNMRLARTLSVESYARLHYGGDLVRIGAVTPKSIQNLVFDSNGNAALVIDLGVGSSFDVRTERLAFTFDETPLLVNRTGVNQSSTRGAVQLTYAASSESYLIGDTAIRYILIAFLLLVGLTVDVAHTTIRDISVEPLIFFRPDSWMALLKTWRTTRNSVSRTPLATSILCFVAMCCIVVDPLSAGFLAFPASPFFQAWSLHIMPWLRISLGAFVGVWNIAFFTRSGEGLMTRGNFPWTKILVLFSPTCFLCFLSVVLGIAHDQPSVPSSISAGDGQSMIPSVIGFFLPFPLLLVVFFGYRHRLLHAHKKGVDDPSPPLFGSDVRSLQTQRIGVVYARVLLPFLIWAWLFFNGVYFGILTYESSLLPTYYCGSLVECLWCCVIVCLAALLTLPMRYSTQVVPPHPSTLVRDVVQHNNKAVIRVWSTLQKPLEGNGGESSSMSMVPLLHGEQGADALRRYSGEERSGENAVEEHGDWPAWMCMVWKPQYFDSVSSGTASGAHYAFVTEVQWLAFERLNLATRCDSANARSFFCWETAVRCLNVSNEAYNEVEGSDDIDHLVEVAEYQKTCCESAVTRCCFCCLGGGGGKKKQLELSAAVDPIAEVQVEEAAVAEGRMSVSSRRFTQQAEEDDFVVIPREPLMPSTGVTPPADLAAKPVTSKSLTDGLAQINIARFGYRLVKVIDVFGVRVLIGATPVATGAVGRTHASPHLIIAFRGTVNLRNALTDVNARMMQHPEMHSGCEVHRGFWVAFQNILPYLRTTLETFLGNRDWSSHLKSIICTGHSLGGALAMLCAYSLSGGGLLPIREIHARHAAGDVEANSTHHALPIHNQHAPGLQSLIPVSCVTFGSPRVGNDKFATQYNRFCPETYRVVNENDVVASVGLCWHHHAGRPIFINRDGDAVVGGTWMENEYNFTAGVGSSFKNHLLIRYGDSMDNILCERNLGKLCPQCCSFLLVHP